MEINKRSLEYFPVQLFAIIMGLSGVMLSNDDSKFMVARLFSGGSMEEVVKDIEEILGFLHFRFTIF